jgi:hypothetical protein
MPAQISTKTGAGTELRKAPPGCRGDTGPDPPPGQARPAETRAPRVFAGLPAAPADRRRSIVDGRHRGGAGSPIRTPRRAMIAWPETAVSAVAARGGDQPRLLVGPPIVEGVHTRCAIECSGEGADEAMTGLTAGAVATSTFCELFSAFDRGCAKRCRQAPFGNRVPVVADLSATGAVCEQATPTEHSGPTACAPGYLTGLYGRLDIHERFARDVSGQRLPLDAVGMSGVRHRDRIRGPA